MMIYIGTAIGRAKSKDFYQWKNSNDAVVIMTQRKKKKKKKTVQPPEQHARKLRLRRSSCRNKKQGNEVKDKRATCHSL